MRAISVLFTAALAAVLTLAAYAPVTHAAVLPQTGHNGIAPATHVVILSQPGHNGRVEVAVRTEAVLNGTTPNVGPGWAWLTRPYQMATVEAKGQRIIVTQGNQAEIKSRYRTLLAAQPPVTHVVMLPQPGHNSIVEVTPRAEAATAPNAKTVLLTTPYQIATVEAGNQISVKQWNQSGINDRYGALLAAQPPPPHNYLLYFQFNGTRLAPQSAAALDAMLSQILAQRGTEIVVTGYADLVGTVAANDRLSLQRAQVIRAAIIAHGFNPARIYAVGRGSRDPLVPVRVREQRNRRVEITVR